MIHKISLTFFFFFFLVSFLSTNRISLPCTPGKAGDATGCKNCIAGQYQNLTIQTICLDCDEGKASSEGSAVCQICAGGKYVSTKGSNVCFKCPQGWKRAELDPPTTCKQCQIGRTTESNNGSTSCSLCNFGQYGSAPGHCKQCPHSTFTDSKGLLECTVCINGEVNEIKSIW